MQNCVHVYSEALILQWTKAFREVHLLKIKQVKKNLLIVVNDYFNKVYTEQFHTIPTDIKTQKYPFCQKEFEAAQQRMETIYYN